MPQNTTYYQDGSVEAGNWFAHTWLGGLISRNVLGLPSSRFNTNGTTTFPVGRGMLTMDTSENNLLSVAMRHPCLNTIISRGAELFSLMEIRHLDKNGEPIPNSKLLKFLKQPNPIQSREDFLAWFYVLMGVYNKSFQHEIRGLSKNIDAVPSALWLLPPGKMKINVTGKMYRQTDIDEIIKNYEMEGDPLPFTTEDIIYMSSGIGQTPFNTISRVEALQIPLSNIMAALKGRNIVYTELGPKGILSASASKDADGGVRIFDDDEKERIEKAFSKQYGIDANSGRGHIIVTGEDLHWEQTSFNISELQFVEGIEDDLQKIFDAYGHDRDLYCSTGGATFENKKQGKKSTIELGIQPVADRLMRVWTERYCDEKAGDYLEASYEYLPFMKEDQLASEQAQKTKVERLSQLYKDGTLTLEQYQELAEVDPEVIPNAPKNASQANLRGLVGSVTGIIQVNQFVAQGFIGPETGARILVEVYGYDASTASAMITALRVEATTTAPSTTIPKE